MSCEDNLPKFSSYNFLVEQYHWCHLCNMFHGSYFDCDSYKYTNRMSYFYLPLFIIFSDTSNFGVSVFAYSVFARLDFTHI